MRERCFIETTDEMRHAACFVAGWRPGEFREPKLIPVRKAQPPLLSDFRVSPEVRAVRSRCGSAPRRVYEVGAMYGRLRVVTIRPTGWAGGRIYDAACDVCGKVHSYAGSLLNLAMRHNSPCMECRRGRARRQGAA